jgi:hypothetical protein
MISWYWILKEMSRQVTFCHAQGVTPLECAEGETVRRLGACLPFCRRPMQMEHTKKRHPVVGLIILIALGYLVYQAISSIT